MIRRKSLLSLVLAASAALAASPHAAAIGPPSRLAQYFGYGYGPGHHAPIVMTPGHHPEHTPRYAWTPRSSGTLYPAPYAPIGCYGEACYPTPVAAPIMAPAPVLAPPPIVAPESTERQARRF